MNQTQSQQPDFSNYTYTQPSQYQQFSYQQQQPMYPQYPNPQLGVYIQEPQYIQQQQTHSPNLTPIFKIQLEATHSLYIDGVPNDSTEREVSHIFRPFPGFQRVRLIRKTTQKGREYYLCFVDFDDSLQASIAMTTLQGYRFDKSDKQGLKISYANNPKDTKEKKR